MNNDSADDLSDADRPNLKVVKTNIATKHAPHPRNSTQVGSVGQRPLKIRHTKKGAKAEGSNLDVSMKKYPIFKPILLL